MATLAQLLQEAVDQRDLFADVLTLKGVPADHTESYNTLVLKLLSMNAIDTSDATATAEDIATGKTAYARGVKIVGTNSGGGGGATQVPLMNTESCTTVDAVLSAYGDNTYIYTSSEATGTPFDTLRNVYNHFSSYSNYIDKVQQDTAYGIRLGNFTEQNTNNGILFTNSITLNANSLIMINAYISDWMNDTLKLHLISTSETSPSAILADLKQKILDESYDYSLNISYPGSLSRKDVFAEMTNPSGTYYVYIDGTRTGNNDNLTYYNIKFINL